MEHWENITGYEGLYMVSNLGRVKSLDRVSRYGRRLSGKMLNIGRNKTGYCYVVLCKNGWTKSISVHRLVALTFISNPENLPQINHIDEDKTNNNASNLEWVTARQNQNHSANKKAVSKYPGVFWHPIANKWQAGCRFKGKLKYLGLFKAEKEAAQAYVDFCNKHKLK